MLYTNFTPWRITVAGQPKELFVVTIAQSLLKQTVIDAVMQQYKYSTDSTSHLYTGYAVRCPLSLVKQYMLQ